MSNLGEKLHNFVTSLRSGEQVAAHDIEEVASSISDHVVSTIVPAIENHLRDVLPEMAKKAVSDGLEAERAEALKIAQRIEAAYTQLAKDHGAEVAQTVASAAANGTLDPEPVQAAEVPPNNAPATINEVREELNFQPGSLHGTSEPGAGSVPLTATESPEHPAS